MMNRTRKRAPAGMRRADNLKFTVDGVPFEVETFVSLKTGGWQANVLGTLIMTGSRDALRVACKQHVRGRVEIARHRWIAIQAGHNKKFRHGGYAFETEVWESVETPGGVYWREVTVLEDSTVLWDSSESPWHGPFKRVGHLDFVAHPWSEGLWAKVVALQKAFDALVAQIEALCSDTQALNSLSASALEGFAALDTTARALVNRYVIDE